MEVRDVPAHLKKLVDFEVLEVNEAIALQLIYKAIYQGSIRAIKEIMDRTEGRSVQRTQLSGPDGEAIPLRFTGIEIVKPEE